MKDLKSIGFNARLCPTEGHPMVLAHYRGPANAPHVLFYGHYDVQPVDSGIALEQSAVRTEGRGRQAARARTSDDKGQLMTFVEAARAFQARRGRAAAQRDHPFRGRGGVGHALAQAVPGGAQDELKADIALVCDTNMW